jgi:small subunit ribosomal protein S17
MEKEGTQTNTAEKNSRTLKGVVVSDTMDKTVVVKVDRYVKHPLYKKFVKKSKKYKARDESNAFAKGDTVEIRESKPYSKTEASAS